MCGINTHPKGYQSTCPWEVLGLVAIAHIPPPLAVEVGMVAVSCFQLRCEEVAVYHPLGF